MMNRVIIVGGGASGIMAAITAARNGAQVTVLEQNDRPGRKILATGNGKCNLTNLDMDPRHYHTDNPERLRAVLKKWTEKDTIDFFSGIGLDMHDRNGWVYPATDQSSSVLSLLLLTARENGVKIKTREHVTEIRIRHEKTGITEGEKQSAGQKNESADRLGRFAVLTDTWHYDADRVIIACGSPASAVTGSSDDLIRFAGQLDIPCREFLPALVPLRVRDQRSSAWAGVRVHARVTILADDMETASDVGEIQLTQNSISGIPVFQVSGSAVRALEKGKRVFAVLNFMPDLTDEETALSLMNKHRSNPGRRTADLLTGMLPDRIIPLFKKEIQAAQDKLDQTAEQKQNPDGMFLPLAEKIRHYRVEISGAASMKQAQTCSGGVPLSELTEDLESRRVPGIYFTGETADADGECGGYGLQWAFASGHAAGVAASFVKNHTP